MVKVHLFQNRRAVPTDNLSQVQVGFELRTAGSEITRLLKDTHGTR